MRGRDFFCILLLACLKGVKGRKLKRFFNCLWKVMVMYYFVIIILSVL